MLLQHGMKTALAAMVVIVVDVIAAAAVAAAALLLLGVVLLASVVPTPLAFDTVTWGHPLCPLWIPPTSP